jgi:hypothetical protein
MNNNNNEYSYQKSPFNYNKLNKNNKYSKEVITQILTGDTINTQKLLKELDYEKYIKKIVGVRYRDHFVSYEEEKLVKLIDSYNIRDKIFNRKRKNKIFSFKGGLGNKNRLITPKSAFKSNLFKK